MAAAAAKAEGRRGGGGSFGDDLARDSQHAWRSFCIGFWERERKGMMMRKRRKDEKAERERKSNRE